jgi:hypothetical protein
MTDEIKRDPSGKFVKGAPSPNKSGRPKNTKGSKHKVSRAKLETLLMSAGPESFKQIQEIAALALANKDIGTALRCHFFIGQKFYELVVHGDRLEVQELKRLQKEKESEDEQDDEVFEAPQVSFSFTPVVVNE